MAFLNNGATTVFSVNPVETEDSTGAGDTFIGGFLAAWVKAQTLRGGESRHNGRQRTADVAIGRSEPELGYMPRRAWYIGCTEDEIGEAAILVGDRARIDRIAGHLEKPAFVVENRGLRTVKGFRSGKRVTASAFGMGGPIAAIVLHELFDLGVRTFLRIGTAMVMPPAEVGDFVVADGSISRRGRITHLRTAWLSGCPRLRSWDHPARSPGQTWPPMARGRVWNL